MLTLTTWNVQNLFRPGSRPEYPDTEAARKSYLDKIDRIARIVRDLAPDVIGLQEIGGKAALMDLQKAMPEYEHEHVAPSDRRGICCGVLSRLPLESKEDIVDLPAFIRSARLQDPDGKPMEAMGRGAACVTIEKEGFRARVIVLHLKSKLLSFPDGQFNTKDEVLRARVAALALVRRTAEATAVRMAVDEHLNADSSTAIAVMGDFNDGPTAATTQLLQGPGGSEIGTTGFDRKDSGDRARLWNLAACIDESRRFSRIHQGQGELLDQIFVSESFLPHVSKKRALPRVDALVDELESIGDEPRTTRGVSDHAPVTVHFLMKLSNEGEHE